MARTCDSNAGFSIIQLMKTDRYCLTMKGFTLAPLFFLFIVSTRDLAAHAAQLPCLIARLVLRMQKLPMAD